MSTSTEKTPHVALPKPKNGTGRDLGKAITVGVLLGLIAIISLIYTPLWYPFIAIAAALASWEVTTRLSERGYHLSVWYTVIASQAVIWASYFYGGVGILYALIPTALILFIYRLFQQNAYPKSQSYTRDISMGVFVFLWIPVFASCAAMLINMEDGKGPVLLATMFLCVVANDIGGYTAGIFAGSHPMAPAISPKKSWEGFAGSVITAMIVGAVCAIFLLDMPFWIGMLMGIALAVTATLGDLVESQFKRDLGIKDMSGMLPGHGGIMDRMDGLLPSAAMMWLFVTALF